MAENSGGYIGNKPSDSSVTIARQAYTSTGVTTDFTFRSGYTPGYLDAYLNGVRLIETDDYVATDGTTLSLSTAAQDGDTLELIAYKAFNVSEFTLETELGGNFNVSNDLTVGGNINLEGNLDLQDNDKILLGTGDDLQIFHNTSHGLIENNTGSLYLFNYADDQDIILSTDNGSGGTNTYILCDGSENSTKLYAAGSVKLKTISTGVDVTGVVQTDTLDVSGASTFSGNLNIGTGATVGFGSTAYFRDNASAIFGDGEDLKIYHNGSHSYIDETGTGNLYIRNGTKNSIWCQSDGQVNLYYNDNKKFQTTNTGAIVTGILTATDFSGASGGAADFPNGLTGTTGTFSGNVSAVDGTFTGNVSIAGTLTYEDVTNIDSIGIVTARAGVNVTGGSLTVDAFSNTANNYLSLRNGYAPSASGGMGFMSADHSGSNADGVAIYGHDGISLYTAQEERLRATSGGNIGIGTDNPETKLHVSDGHTASADNFDSNIVLAISKNTTVDSFAGIAINSGNNAASFIHFGDTDDSNVGRLDYSHSDNAFKFFTNGDSTKRLGISSTGMVQIGGDVEDAANDIDASNTKLTIKQSGMGLEDGIYIERPSERRGHYIRVATSGNAQDALVFGTTHWGTETDHLLALDRDGNVTMKAGSVGIGTDNPSRKLHVASSGTDSLILVTGTTPQIRLNSNASDSSDDDRAIFGLATANSHFVNTAVSGDTVIRTTNGGDLIFGEGTTETVRISGIGTVSTVGSVKIGSSNVVEINPSNEYPTIRPTLDLNFAATKTLDRRITFTRDSLATYYGEDGLLKYASNNVPRFDHDPDTRESLGLLIEHSSTNLISGSGGYGSDIRSGTNLGNAPTTEVVDGITLPDGTVGQVRRLQIHSSGNSGMRWGSTGGGNINTAYSASVWARAVSGTATFSIDTNDQGNIAYGLTEEWVRMKVTGTTSEGAYQFLDIVGNANANGYFWGFQLENKPFVSSYIPVASNESSKTRAQDNAKITGTNFTGFYNQNESTLFVNYKLDKNNYLESPAGVDMVTFRTDGSSHGYELRIVTNTSTPTLDAHGVHNSVAQYDLAGISLSSGFKDYFVAKAFKLNDVAVSFDGATPQTDTTSAVVERDTLFIGYVPRRAHYKSIKYFNKRLPNAQLQGLTSQ